MCGSKLCRYFQGIFFFRFVFPRQEAFHQGMWKPKYHAAQFNTFPHVFHRGKHFSLTPSALLPKESGCAGWAKKIICWWGLEISPSLNASLRGTCIQIPRGQAKDTLDVSLYLQEPCPFGHNWSNSGKADPGKVISTGMVWPHTSTPPLIFAIP